MSSRKRLVVDVVQSYEEIWLSFLREECIALASTTKLKKKKKQLTDDSKFAILSESRAIELMKMKSSGDDDPLAEATKYALLLPYESVRKVSLNISVDSTIDRELALALISVKSAFGDVVVNASTTKDAKVFLVELLRRLQGVQSCGFILRRLCTRQRVQTNDSRRRRFVFVLTRCRGVSQPRQRQNCFEYVFEPIKFEKVYCECEERRFEKLHVHGSVRVPTRFERFKRKATTIAIHTLFILSFITFRSL